MPIVRLDQQRKRVKVAEFELDSPIVFEFLDQIPEGSRDETLTRAIYIGVLALKEDRLASFLARTQNELGTQLESLKLIFDLKQQVFYETTQKGAAAEEEVADVLRDFIARRKWTDKVEVTGTTAGLLKRNKTGDLVCTLDNRDDRRLVIECKFDKSIKLGEVWTRDAFGRNSDTAWSQLLEAQVNRDGRVSLIVFDSNLVDPALAREADPVSFIPGVGFLCIVDTLKGDYRPLFVAYNLARQIAVAAKELDLRDKFLVLLVRRMLQALQGALGVRKMVEQNIETNLDILRCLNKSLLLLEFTQGYLERLLETGTLTPKDMLEFYQGEEIKERFQAVEKDIKALGTAKGTSHEK